MAIIECYFKYEFQINVKVLTLKTTNKTKYINKICKKHSSVNFK